MSSRRIEPVEGELKASIQPPGSKSITNRALICAAAAHGESTLTGVLRSEDTAVMIDSLAEVGVRVDEQADTVLGVHGCGGRFQSPPRDLFVANSGTTVRFLTALLAAAGGDYRLDGVERMRERPIGDLVDALRQLSVDVAAESPNGCPPVRIRSQGMAAGAVQVRGDISSQYLSGLLMAAPLAKGEIQIGVEGELVSKPYVRMTLAVMRSFGAVVQSEGLQSFSISPAPYQPQQYAIEPDASAASYFWAAAAICGGEICVEGLSRDALQGDVDFCDVLAQMGCDVDYAEESITVRRAAPLRGIDVDMNAISDTVQTLAAVALFADGPTRVRGVAHNRHKETDRIGDLARELRKLGAEVAEHEDGMTITPGPTRGARVQTYQDHRMAMSLALVGLKTPGVEILDPACVDKTYPAFFEEFHRVTGG